jgi:hypothetical protein
METRQSRDSVVLAHEFVPDPRLGAGSKEETEGTAEPSNRRQQDDQ